MFNCIWSIFLLFVSLSIYVEALHKQEGASKLENRIKGKRNFWNISGKADVERRGETDEHLKIVHLCIKERDEKQRLITCDKRHSSQFACVGAWRGGDIKPCDKLSKTEVAVPICVQEKTSYVKICEQKRLAAINLCLPKQLKKIYKTSNHQSKVKTYNNLSTNIQPCSNAQQRICLEKENLILCDHIRNDNPQKIHSNLDFKQITGTNIINLHYRYPNQKQSTLSNTKINLQNKNRAINIPFNYKANKFESWYKPSKSNLNTIVRKNIENKSRKMKYQAENIKNKELKITHRSSKLSDGKLGTIYKKSKPHLKELQNKHKYRSYKYGKDVLNPTKSKRSNKGQRFPTTKQASKNTTPKYPDESQTRKYFYVVKCHDCDIENAMVVDVNAPEVLPNVKVLEFSK
ncbi:uncharacterized protein NPIL_245561 [Nephila pilipes]|uniref:Uncharacterized protein n=1 Tax=Nephila pilipes TaxID=299642 RepID=A0A8X6MRI9_NEPPI|nr:uncharacterized protein NPIL_245561 [Nephila pilipes]